MKDINMDQPSNVCFDCGNKYGKHLSKDGRAVGMWQAVCDVCGKDAGCCAARDFGYLKPEWKKETEQ